MLRGFPTPSTPPPSKNFGMESIKHPSLGSMDHDGSFYTRGWLREKTERELLGEIRLYLLVITILVVSSACGVVIFGLSNLSNVNEIKQYVRDIKNMETLQPKQIDAMLANVFATVDNTRKISDMSVPTAARVFQGMDNPETVAATHKVMESAAKMPPEQLSKFMGSVTDLIGTTAQTMRDANITRLAGYVQTNPDFLAAVKFGKDFVKSFYERFVRFERVAAKLSHDLQEF